MSLDDKEPPVLLERFGSVVSLTINRIHVDNRLDETAIQLLLAHVETLASNGEARAIILTGQGQTFSAGADIKGWVNPIVEGDSSWLRWGHRLTDAVAALPQPTMTVINGLACDAGFELALATDLRLLAQNAQVGLQQVRKGTIPSWGGAQRLARLVGPARAKELIFTGRLLGSDEALCLGLVNSVHPNEQLFSEALILAGQLVELSADAMSAAKEVIDSGLDKDLESANQIEMAVVERLSMDSKANSKQPKT